MPDEPTTLRALRRALLVYSERMGDARDDAEVVCALEDAIRSFEAAWKEGRVNLHPDESGHLRAAWGGTLAQGERGV